MLSEKLHRQARQALAAGDLAEAEHVLARALKRHPDDHMALALSGELHLRRNRAYEGFRSYLKAVNAAPQMHAYKERFLELASLGFPMRYNDELASALVACLKTPDLASQLENWFGLMASEPKFHAAYGLTNRRSFDPANAAFFASITDFRPLFAPLFLEGLKSNLVCNPVFEEFITSIRRHLLDELDAPARRLRDEEIVTLASAVAHYALYSEFIMEVSEDERTKTHALRKRVETPKGAADSSALAVLACYMPLHTLENARAILALHKDSGPLASLVLSHIADHFRLTETAGEIPLLTEIHEDASIRVRDQYESFPYPRWKTISRDRLLREWLGDPCSQKAEGPLQGKKIDILLAGCGTGYEAVMFGLIFPEAKITAVDLSRTSLAYAVVKARDHGLTNIAFAQADILKLGEVGAKFDYIASAGVLHHMQNPFEGWQVLRGLLKPGGLMRIGLYSQTGRKAVVAAQEAIRKGGYRPTRESMLRFRRDCPRLCDPATLNTLAKLKDYYQLSMYRDLLFHVQEQRFELAEIKSMLGRLSLSFAGFHVPPSVLASYHSRFPADPDAVDLDHWRAFEEQNPETFLSMYTFWCRPR